jgi:hypothetical protein
MMNERERIKRGTKQAALDAIAILDAHWDVRHENGEVEKRGRQQYYMESAAPVLAFHFDVTDRVRDAFWSWGEPDYFAPV